uniref:Uncharacterized protein n=1 Tax=Oryza meridionalis TaxID=40149 RepID=A0A0E0D846_9ORYZ
MEGISRWAPQNLKQPASATQVADGDGRAGWPTTLVARSPPLRRGVVAVAVVGSSPLEWRRGGQIRPGLAGSGLGQRRRRLAGKVSAWSPSSRSPLYLQPSPTPDSAASRVASPTTGSPSSSSRPSSSSSPSRWRPMERIDERAAPWERGEGER